MITSTGHTRTVVHPVGEARARYYHADAVPGLSPEEWLTSAIEHADSWWLRYAEWLKARSGQMVDAPRVLGNPQNPALDPAPGRYVQGVTARCCPDIDAPLSKWCQVKPTLDMVQRTSSAPVDLSLARVPLRKLLKASVHSRVSAR